jgi:hypothetical protein
VACLDLARRVEAREGGGTLVMRGLEVAAAGLVLLHRGRTNEVP